MKLLHLVRWFIWIVYVYVCMYIYIYIYIYIYYQMQHLNANVCRIFEWYAFLRIHYVFSADHKLYVLLQCDICHFICTYLWRCHKDRPVRQTDQHLSHSQRSVSALFHCGAKNALGCVESEVTGYRCLDACATRNNLFLCLFSDAVLTACVNP